MKMTFTIITALNLAVRFIRVMGMITNMAAIINSSAKTIINKLYIDLSLILTDIHSIMKH